MIINGGSRRKWRRFAVHLANEKDNERVRLTEVRGMKASSIKEGFAQLQAMADLAGAGEKEFYYHANMNPKESEELTAQQWEQAGERLRGNLGLSGQPGMTVEHVKDGRTHRHFIALRVDLDTGKLISDGWNYARHEKTARELERDFELEKVKGALAEREGPRPERRPKNWEVQRGNRSGIDPQDVKTEITALWQNTDTGAAFRTALAQRGYVLARGDRRDFCVIDPAGHEHSLARRISGAKAADIRTRLADIDRDELPRVGEGRTERKGDGKRVQEAVKQGADKRNVERAINTARAANTASLPQEDEGDAGTRRRRSAYERETEPDATALSRADVSPGWRERQRERDTEKEPEI
jgi:hypothetical protein